MPKKIEIPALWECIEFKAKERFLMQTMFQQIEKDIFDHRKPNEVFEFSYKIYKIVK